MRLGLQPARDSVIFQFDSHHCFFSSPNNLSSIPSHQHCRCTVEYLGIYHVTLTDTGTRPSSSQPLLSNAIERRNISEKRIPLPAISALRIPILIFFEALCGPGDTRQLATPGTVRLERQQQKQPTPLSRNGRRPARISTSRPTHP